MIFLSDIYDLNCGSFFKPLINYHKCFFKCAETNKFLIIFRAMTTLREAFRPFKKIFIGTVIVVLSSFFFYHRLAFSCTINCYLHFYYCFQQFLNSIFSLPLHFHSCAHGSSWPEHYLDGSVYNYSKELRQFCSDLIVFGHVIEVCF